MPLGSLLLAAQLFAGATPGDPPPGPAKLWAGHLVAYGTRVIPFHGTVRTRSDTFVLARISGPREKPVLTQEPCRIAFRPTAGVQLAMGVRGLPREEVHFVAGSATTLEGRSEVSWGAEDIDRDGHPGMTVSITSSLCSGDLYIRHHAQSSSTGYFKGDRLEGHSEVHIRQHVLGASSLCLRVVARASDEVVRGPIAYVPVSADATCQSLLRETWPVDAESTDHRR